VQSVTEDDLLQVLQYGPFNVALHAAIQARGLSLEALRRRLEDQGIAVSLSTLSYWQRGRTRPERADSLRAVRALEVILGLPRHSLLTLLKPSAERSAGPWLPVEELCPEPGVRDLMDEIGERGERQLTGLSQHDQHVIGPGRELREVRSRAVFQAQQRGADRWIAVYHHPQRVLPSSRTARGCRFGRVRVDEASGLIAAELLFDRVLGRGETYLLEYGFGFEETGPPVAEEGRGFRTPQHEFLMEVRFHPSALPARCYRTWRPDAQTALKDLADLRLSSYHSAHFIEFGVTAGYHGMRWEWE
jgi:transcriptional regulator with XRE-family HTH domain